MKFKKMNLTLSQIMVLGALIIELQFFYIFPLPKIFWIGNNSDNKTYILIILYMALLLMLLKKSFKIKITKKNKFLAIYLIIQIILSILLMYRSMKIYNQSAFDLLMAADYLMMPVTACVFIKAMKDKVGFEKMMSIVFSMLLFIQIIIFLQGVSYSLIGVIPFKGMSSTGLPRFRYGRIRAEWSSINFIGFTYSVSELWHHHKEITSKKKVYWMLGLSAINLIVFCQTRAILIASLLSCMAMLVLSSSRSKKKWMMMIVAVVCSVLLISGGALSNFISSFDINGDLGGSTSVRLHEIEYYWMAFKNNPIFGLGLVRPIRPDLKLVYGGLAGGTPTDVGLLGLAAETGLIGILLFVILLLRFFYIIKKIWKKSTYSLFLVGIISYIVATLPSLIVTNITRIVALPLCIAIFESVYYNVKLMEKAKELNEVK
ncbi:O-antigen ligase family protein [Jeotgalibaca sp. A122]|uniref:O-antigen ligase family protein n=1 Tax=Jeotgalibaca sp. A122 TaxID=3457322 RepID=UPI003FD0EC6C